MKENEICLLASLVGPCPQCHNGKLRPVSDGDGMNFLCEECGACWHPELDWVCRVDPATCPGCSSRAVCTSS